MPRQSWHLPLLQGELKWVKRDSMTSQLLRCQSKRRENTGEYGKSYQILTLCKACPEWPAPIK